MDELQWGSFQHVEPRVSYEDKMLSLQTVRSIFGEEEKRVNLLQFSVGCAFDEGYHKTALLLVCWFANPRRQKKFSEVYMLGKRRDPSNDPTMLGCMLVNNTDPFAVFEKLRDVERHNQLLRVMVCPIPIRRCLGLLPERSGPLCGHDHLINGGTTMDPDNNLILEGYPDIQTFISAQDNASLLWTDRDQRELINDADARLFVSRRMQFGALNIRAGAPMTFARAFMPLTPENFKLLSSCPVFHADLAPRIFDDPFLAPSRERQSPDRERRQDVIAG